MCNDFAWQWKARTQRWQIDLLTVPWGTWKAVRSGKYHIRKHPGKSSFSARKLWCQEPTGRCYRDLSLRLYAESRDRNTADVFRPKKIRQPWSSTDSTEL